MGRHAVLGGLLVGVALVTSGCSSTQDEAARLQLNSARIRAAELPTVVRVAGTRATVDSVTLLRASGGGSAIVVRVGNTGRRTVTDLPISVGVRVAHHGAIDLNTHSAAELSYFSSHLPAISAGHTLTWVYTTGRALDRSARPYALVGNRPGPALARRLSGALPRIEAQALSHTRSGHGRWRVTIRLRNTTTVPQYQLPVDAIARRDGRTVAAGTLVIAYLGSHATRRVTLTVIGQLDHAQLQLTAAPTIYQ